MRYGSLSVTGVTEERSEKQLWVTPVTDSDRSFIGYSELPSGSQEVTAWSHPHPNNAAFCGLGF